MQWRPEGRALLQTRPQVVRRPPSSTPIEIACSSPGFNWRRDGASRWSSASWSRKHCSGWRPATKGFSCARLRIKEGRRPRFHFEYSRGRTKRNVRHRFARTRWTLAELIGAGSQRRTELEWLSRCCQRPAARQSSVLAVHCRFSPALWVGRSAAGRSLHGGPLKTKERRQCCEPALVASKLTRSVSQQHRVRG